MIVVEKLAAKLKVELTAKLRDSFSNVLGLKLEIFFIVKADLAHISHPDSNINNTKNIISISQIKCFFNTIFKFIVSFYEFFCEINQQVMHAASPADILIRCYFMSELEMYCIKILLKLHTVEKEVCGSIIRCKKVGLSLVS